MYVMENNTAADFQFTQPPTPPIQQKSIPNFTSFSNPTKKRGTKMMSMSHHIADTSRNNSIDGSGVLKRKKPDPSAPKITMPCSECGKTFWSWKALFGHMRCHPERQWRGINPPPNLVRRHHHHHTEEDHEIATCLLMLAANDHDESQHGHFGKCGFECSSCKTVFGSHQALGGHRASHKDVKGCFAITSTCNYEEGEVSERLDEKMRMGILGEHKCSICFRVF